MIVLIEQSFRRLRRDAIRSVITIALLGFGIGWVVASISLANALLWAPLPGVPGVPAQELVSLGWAGAGGQFDRASPNLIDALRSESIALRSIAGTFSGSRSLLVADQRFELQVAGVTEGYFAGLGPGVAVGRALQLTDFDPQAPAQAVISDGLWARAFARDPRAIGAELRLNDSVIRVIGIAPPRFRGMLLQGDQDLWMAWPALMRATHPELPLALLRRSDLFQVYGRLAPGENIQRVRLDLERLSHVDGGLPNRNGRVLLAMSGATGNPGALAGLRAHVLLVTLLASLCLAIVCSNVASQTLAGLPSRRTEFATRLAVGARPRDLIFLVCAEGAVLTLLAAGLGAWIAFAIIRVMLTVPPFAPDASRIDIPLDGSIVLMTVSLVLGLVIVVALVPALFVARDRAIVMEMRAREAPGRALLRRSLVAIQCLIAVVVIAAALRIGSDSIATERLGLGVDSTGVMLLRLEPGEGGSASDAGQAALFARELEAALLAIPGVDAAGIVSGLSLRGQPESARLQMAGGENSIDAELVQVSPGALRGLGIQLDAGDDDSLATSGSMVISQSVARVLGFATHELGLPIVSAQGRGWTISGVASDTFLRGSRFGATPAVYVPLGARIAFSDVVVRGKANQALVAQRVRAVVAEHYPGLRVSAPEPLAAALQKVLNIDRVLVALAVLATALAISISMFGLFGLMYRAVSDRRREIAIRQALGADDPAIAKSLYSEAGVIAALGAITGTVAWPFVSALLVPPGANAGVPSAYWASAASVVVVAAAVLVTRPIVRMALKVLPSEALRYE